MSMLLAIGSVMGYLALAGYSLPPSGNVQMFGPVPLVPLAFVVVVSGIGLALATYVWRPLRQLSEAVARIAQGHLGTHASPLEGGARDEIARLAHEFDGMASRIEQLTQTNGALLHDISHELRSPLTRLQAAIGLLRKDSTQASALIERIEREGERLDMLLEDRLTLHRMCAGLSDVAPQRVDVVELLQSIAHDADFEALATQRILRLETPGSFVVEAHGDLLYRTFANVIRNALKFSPPGSAIDVSACLSDRGKTLVTTVKDRGPGVSSEMLQAIFDPVASVAGGEPVRGIGLSLAIAQRVIFLHGGQIEAASREGGGLIVMLSLPRCN